MRILSAFLACSLLAVPLSAARIELVAGGSEPRVDIPATQAKLTMPFGVDFDATGGIYIVEFGPGARLLRIDTKGVMQHLAGQPTVGDSGDDGPAATAQFNGPHNLSVLPSGDVLIGDTWNGRVRRFDPASGRITAVPGYAVPAAQARASGPYCITPDTTGTQLYIANLKQVLRLDLKTGQTTVIAGNGKKGMPADGARAIDAPLVDPRAVAPDRHGNVYILERGGHALRVVTPDGCIRTVVNVSGKKGAAGDEGDARQATLNGPKHLCIDRDDNVIIADTENHLIRRYEPATGKIVRLAGSGKKGPAGLGGDPLACELYQPHGVALDRDGQLYIADSSNHRVLKIVR
ncbi:MAG: hypothetical protein HZA31_04950 [Opitutae bacterium]|nr:hypothetical protein [Opitutae bacterium]